MHGSTRVLVALLFVAAGQTALAHPGRTDANGGHHDRKNGGYHYHGGGVSTPQPRILPRVETRTAPRTASRAAARIAEPVEPPGPTPRQLRLQDSEDQLRQAREHLANAKSILHNLVDNYADTSAADEALRLLIQHQLDDTARDKVREQNEKAAASKLILAKNALRERQPESARRWLNEIVNDYRETEAAKEAAELLQRNPR